MTVEVWKTEKANVIFLKGKDPNPARKKIMKLTEIKGTDWDDCMKQYLEYLKKNPSDKK